MDYIWNIHNTALVKIEVSASQLAEASRVRYLQDKMTFILIDLFSQAAKILVFSDSVIRFDCYEMRMRKQTRADPHA